MGGEGGDDGGGTLRRGQYSSGEGRNGGDRSGSDRSSGVSCKGKGTDDRSRGRRRIDTLILLSVGHSKEAGPNKEPSKYPQHQVLLAV